MSYSVLIALIIVLFASPILGVMHGIFNAQSRVLKLRKLGYVFPIITSLSALLVFIEIITNKGLNSIEIVFPSIQAFDFPISLIFDFNRVLTIHIVSVGFLVAFWGISCYHKDLKKLTGDFIKPELDIRKNRVLIFSNLVLLAFMLMVFSSSVVFFIAGFSLISISYIFIDKKGAPGKFNIFRKNVIADFVILFLLIILMVINSRNELQTGIISAIVFIAILLKVGIPKSTISQNLKQHELKIIFYSLLRPTLIWIVLQHFTNVFFTYSNVGILLITVIFLMIISTLITLYRSSDSLKIIDNISVLATLGMFFFSIHNHFETLLMAYITVISGIFAQIFVFLVLANRTEILTPDLDMKQRFSLENLGGIRRRFPILYLFFVISSLSIAGTLPLEGGWSNFNMYLHLTTNCISSKAIIHIAAFIAVSVVFILFIFVQGKIGTYVFSGKYRGSEDHYKSIKLPQKLLLIPLVFIVLSILIGGITNLPGNTAISGVLSGLFTSAAGITNEMNINLFKEFSSSDLVVMLLMLLIPVLIYSISLLRHKTLDSNLLKRNIQKHEDTKDRASLIFRKVDTFINFLSDFVYTVIERLIFHTLFTLIGRLVVFVKNILTFNFQSEEQLQKNKKRFIITVLILVIVVIAVLIGVLW